MTVHFTFIKKYVFKILKKLIPYNFLKRHNFISFFSFSTIGSDKKVEDSENDRFMIDSNVSKTQGANFAAKAKDHSIYIRAVRS